MRISDWSSDVCSSDLSKASRKACATHPKKRNLKLSRNAFKPKKPSTSRQKKKTTPEKRAVPSFDHFSFSGSFTHVRRQFYCAYAARRHSAGRPRASKPAKSRPYHRPPGRDRKIAVEGKSSSARINPRG